MHRICCNLSDCAIAFGLSLRCLLFGLMAFLWCYSPTNARSQVLSNEEALSVLASLVESCTAVPKQDKAFTSLVVNTAKPDLERFEKLTYSGIKKIDGEWTDAKLVQTRSNAYAFLVSGKRKRLIREFSSECVLTLMHREITEDVHNLGAYSKKWDTNYSVCHLYDAKSRLGYKRAQAVPGISSVVTEEDSAPYSPQSLNRLYDLEPQIKFAILSALSQTNSVGAKQLCSPVWEDFSSFTLNKKNIQLAINSGKILVEAGDFPGNFRIEFKLNNIRLVLSYAPKQSIWIPKVDFLDRETLVRTIRRSLVNGELWFAELVDINTLLHNPEYNYTNQIFYYHEEITDEKTEVESFAASFLKDAKQTAHKNKDGHYVETLDGKFWREYDSTASGVVGIAAVDKQRREKQIRIATLACFVVLTICFLFKFCVKK